MKSSSFVGFIFITEYSRI